MSTLAANVSSVTADAKPADLESEIYAALVAVVHMTCGPRARIASVVHIGTPTQEWGMEGRRIIHSMRKVR